MENKRIYFLDNLRTFMIFLVVLYHTGLIYESSGIPAPWWIVDDPMTNDLTGIINIVVDIALMATIFFISGFFVAQSVKSRFAPDFLRSRIRRLIVPWIFAVIILIPVYKIIFLYSRNLPREHWTTYFHWTNGNWSQNWLWFLPVLFLFHMLYLVLTKIPVHNIKISLKLAVPVVFVVGVAYSFFMKKFNLEGWTKTFFLDFQNERIFIYFLYFLLGAVCTRQNTFTNPPKSKKLFIAACITVWMPVFFYFFMLIFSIFRPETYIISETGDQLLYCISFHVSLSGLLYVFVNTFRLFFDKQGKIRNELNNNSYGVYIVHVIVLGFTALVFLDSCLDSKVKYILVTIITYFLSNVSVYIYKKIRIGFMSLLKNF